MSLRRRLLVATAALLALLSLAAVAVLGVQRAYLIDQVDEELRAVAGSPRAVLGMTNRGDAAVTGAFSEVYFGRLPANGRLVTLVAPASDPELVPKLTGREEIGVPRTRASASGRARSVRVLVTRLPRGTAVIGIPLTSTQQATRRLAATLAISGAIVLAGLALVLFWVDRLGLRPISTMTAAADAISRGDAPRAVPEGPPGTEAAQLGRAFNGMLTQVSESERRLRRFVADASHELRTPLTSIQGYAGLYADAAETPEVRDSLRRIGAESRRMGRIVDGLLDLTMLEESGVEARDRVPLAPLLGDVAADLRVLAPDRTVEVSGPADAAVLGDADRLLQAVVALTSNALRHTPAGTGIRLGWEVRQEQVLITVADAGEGIAAEHLPYLFERFYRVDPGRAPGAGGSGLGLAIAAAIVRAHGGRIEATSVPGQGTTFTLTLPGWRSDLGT